MLTLSFEEIQPNRFIQIYDDFNSKNCWFLYSNTIGRTVFEIFTGKIPTEHNLGDFEHL